MRESLPRLILVICGYIPLAALVHAGLLEPLLPFVRDVNLLVPLIVALAALRPTPMVAFGNFLAGLLYDVGVGLVLGPQAGAAVATWLALSLVASRLFLESKLTGFLLAGGAALLFSLFRLAFTLQFIPQATQSISGVLVGAILSALVSIIIAPPLRRLLSPGGERSRGDRDYVLRSGRRSSS